MKQEKKVVDTEVPLLPEFHTTDQYHGTKTGTIFGAVFNISTTMIGAGIMSIPATMKVLGIIPGFIALIVFALLTEVTVEFLLRYTRLSRSSTYGGLMAESFGHVGSFAVQISVMISDLGCLIIYLIIIGDVLCGSNSEEALHLGLLQEWLGFYWWNSRTYALLFIMLFVMLPLVLLRQIDSLKYTSAISVLLAIVFIAITSVIAIYAMWQGRTQKMRLLPDIGDQVTIFDLFTAVPVLVAGFGFHLNVHPIRAELKQPSEMRSAVQIALTIGLAIYLAVGFFGYLLFGDSIMADMLVNFDQNFSATIGQFLNDCVRLSYAGHLLLVFPVMNYPLRANIDELLFPKKAPLATDTPRFVLLTCSLLIFVYLMAVAFPNIWYFFQFMGSTTMVLLGFIFPGSIVLRDIYGIATRRDKILAITTIILATATSVIAISNNLYTMFV